MTKIGLTIENIRFVSMISPAVAIVGPLIAGPIADKLASRQSKNDKSSTGRYLRVMIAVACIFSALFYPLLLLVPTVDRALPSAERCPDLKFNCDQHGAIVRLRTIWSLGRLRRLNWMQIKYKRRSTKIYRKYLHCAKCPKSSHFLFMILWLIIQRFLFEERRK